MWRRLQDAERLRQEAQSVKRSKRRGAWSPGGEEVKK